MTGEEAEDVFSHLPENKQRGQSLPNVSVMTSLLLFVLNEETTLSSTQWPSQGKGQFTEATRFTFEHFKGK